MKPMTYKGYSALIVYSDEDESFIGRVAGIRDILSFHGESVKGLRKAFRETVDFYLESCAGSACRRRHGGRGERQEHQSVGGRRAGARDGAVTVVPIRSRSILSHFSSCSLRSETARP